MIKIKGAEVSVHTPVSSPRAASTLGISSNSLPLPQSATGGELVWPLSSQTLHLPAKQCHSHSAPTRHAESCFSWMLIQIHPSQLCIRAHLSQCLYQPATCSKVTSGAGLWQIPSLLMCTHPGKESNPWLDPAVAAYYYLPSHLLTVT